LTRLKLQQPRRRENVIKRRKKINKLKMALIAGVLIGLDLAIRGKKPMKALNLHEQLRDKDPSTLSTPH
jgi:hypothetical protein